MHTVYTRDYENPVKYEFWMFVFYLVFLAPISMCVSLYRCTMHYKYLYYYLHPSDRKRKEERRGKNHPTRHAPAHLLSYLPPSRGAHKQKAEHRIAAQATKRDRGREHN